MERLISLSLARRSIEYARRAVWGRTVCAKFLSRLGARIDPKSQELSMHEESSCLVRENFIRLIAEGGGAVSRSWAETLGGIASICPRSSNKSSVTAVQW